MVAFESDTIRHNILITILILETNKQWGDEAWVEISNTHVLNIKGEVQELRTT